MDNTADNIFRIISFAAFTLTIAAVALHFVFHRSKGTKSPEVKEIIKFKLISLKTFKILIFIAVSFCIIVLIITGFFPNLILFQTISGYWLILHVTIAVPFIFCMVLLALTYAEQFSSKKYPFLVKATFWLLILLALPLILSIVLSMFPLFGTYGQELLAEIHRYSALLLSMIAILHCYLSFG